MDVGNQVEFVMHYALIRGMTCLGHWDEFPKVSALVYVMHIG